MRAGEARVLLDRARGAWRGCMPTYCAHIKGRFHRIGPEDKFNEKGTGLFHPLGWYSWPGFIGCLWKLGIKEQGKGNI